MQQALQTLEEHAKTLIQAEPEKNWLSLMRNKAGELSVDLDVKDADLQRYLDDAERFLNPAKVYKKGQQLDATESIFLLDGLIKLGEANVIVGQPKVGKSSFSTGLVAALRDSLPCFLGRDLMLPSQQMPVLLFGTDQSEGDWLHFLRREGLVDERQASGLDFFCSLEAGNEFNFTREGLRKMREVIEQYQFPLVIIDSLSSMMEPTGIEENTSRYAQPIRNAIGQLRRTGATLVIIHHSVKRPTTWDWITECRGSSSISSVFSWGVLMRWVTSEEDGLMRTDKRVGFTGKGRGSGESGGVMAEYLADGGWTFLDGLEAAQQVERVRQRIMELGGVRASVFDYLTMRTELNADVSADELAAELNKTRSNISRELSALKAKGLVEIARKEETGARPRPFWMLTQAAQQAMSPGGDTFDSSDSFPKRINKIKVFNSQGAEKQPFQAPKESTPSGPVQLLRNGSWSNGFVIRDASNLNAITVEKLGTPSVTISNLRWMMDVRPCPAPLPEPDFDF